MSTTIHLLLIEDSIADADLTAECLAEVDANVRVHHALDAVEALRVLRREGEHVAAPQPKLVLLDLNLPKMSGHDFLQEVRRDDDIKGLPIVVLSSSSAPAEIRACYESGANSYVTKPVGFREFRDVVRSLTSFWFDTAQTPTLMTS